MSPHEDPIQFQLGCLTGQVNALMATINKMSDTITILETRLRNNESAATALTVKMSLVGVMAGGVGSALMSLALKHF